MNEQSYEQSLQRRNGMRNLRWKRDWWWRWRKRSVDCKREIQQGCPFRLFCMWCVWYSRRIHLFQDVEEEDGVEEGNPDNNKLVARDEKFCLRRLMKGKRECSKVILGLKENRRRSKKMKPRRRGALARKKNDDDTDARWWHDVKKNDDGWYYDVSGGLKVLEIIHYYG